MMMELLFVLIIYELVVKKGNKREAHHGHPLQAVLEER